MDAVNDFKSIRRKLERQEQKVEFDKKNPLVGLVCYSANHGISRNTSNESPQSGAPNVSLEQAL